MNKLPLIAAISLALVASSTATIVVNLQADGLRGDTIGSALTPANSLAFLIVSTMDSIFSLNSILPGSSTNIGTLITGTDDYIVGIIPNTLAARPNPGTLDIAFSNAGAGALALESIVGWTPGDSLALVWFPGLPADATSIPGGTRYGLFTNALAGDGVDPWITPANAGQISVAFGTTDSGYFGGTSPAAAGTTTQTVVPEPATASLGLFGLAALCGFRRRRA